MHTLRVAGAFLLLRGFSTINIVVFLCADVVGLFGRLQAIGQFSRFEQWVGLMDVIDVLTTDAEYVPTACWSQVAETLLG